MRCSLALVVATAAALALTGAGSATLPGRNGLIAFSFDGRGAGAALRGMQPGIAVVRPDGRGVRLLVRYGRSPAWSPDGRRLAFVRSGNVFVMRADGSGVQRLTRRRSDDSPAWSPDGRTIAFVRTIGPRDSQRNVLMVMNADGHHKRPVYLPEPWVFALSGLSWSPDGQWLATAAVTSQVGLILVVASAGSLPGNEWSPASGEVDDSDPDWSPDGTYLAFTRIAWTDGIDVKGVWLTRTDADGPTRPLLVEGASPSWAPDGRSIVAESRDGLVVVDLQGNTRLVFPGGGAEPAWQPLPIK